MTVENDRAAPNSATGFTVWIDDNFHWGDDDERYKHRTFPTLEAAIAASKRVVLEFLEGAYKPGYSPHAFSAWSYAEKLSAAMTAEPISA